MTWTPDSRPMPSFGGDPITPDRILYAYEGPTIFVANFGPVEALFLKVDEDNDSNLYLVTRAVGAKIEALLQGRLSIYGAMDEDQFWIVETDTSFRTKRYWSCGRADVPEDFFPEPSLGLYARFGRLPNTVEQANAFLSVKLEGKSLTSDSIPFNTFKNFVNNIYSAMRNVLIPSLLEGSQGSTFDFEIFQPKLGSLILAIKDPIVNRAMLAKKAKTSDDAILDAVEGQVSEQRKFFFDALRPVVAMADQQEFNLSSVEGDFSVVDHIRFVLPNDGNIIESVEFNATFDGKLNSVFISEKAGARISRAYERAEASALTLHGTITEINDDSGSFRVKSINGRITTCRVIRDVFDDVKNDPIFSIGSLVEIVGRFERRKRIDLLYSDRRPTLRTSPN